MSGEEPTVKLSLDKTSAPFIIGITLFLGIVLGFGVSTFISSINNFNSTVSNSNNPSYSNEFVNQIHQILEEEYLGKVPTDKEITYGMTKGIIESLNDEYTIFLTPEEASKYNDSKDPNFEGIGISLKYTDENTIIESVLQGYPAEKVGLKAGDIISSVDDADVLGKYPAEVANKIRGPKDSEVLVAVLRKSKDSNESESLDFRINREHIDTDNVTYQKLEDGIYKINIIQFIDEDAEAFNKSWDHVVSQIKSEGRVDKIIIDLRNNPGGYVYSLRHALEEFMPRNTILLKEQKKNGEPIIYTDQRQGSFESTPISVIVNESSASASEIFAAAIQDNKRGKVIGQKTVGKGVEQMPIIMDDGSLLILVFQKWLTPNDRNINKENPITPDFIVDYSESDFKSDKDPQLDKALEIVKAN